jgi:hypothetical protein
MKKIGFYSAVCLVLIGCGGGSGTGGVSTTPNGGGNISGRNAGTPTTISENNTTIPRSGIYSASDDEQTKYLKVINYARSIGRECKNNDGKVKEASRGSFSAVNPLTTNSDLFTAALEHSTDLAQSNTFSHTGSGTASDVTGSNLGHPSTFIERIEANGYVGYTTIGENIAGGQDTIEDAVHAWLESPGHCANIMNGNYKEMGLAKYENPSSTYKIYWSNEFGAK